MKPRWSREEEALWSAVQISHLCLQAWLLCISAVCTTPDLRLRLCLVVSAQSLPPVLGCGARTVTGVSSAVASCV